MRVANLRAALAIKCSESRVAVSNEESHRARIMEPQPKAEQARQSSPELEAARNPNKASDNSDIAGRNPSLNDFDNDFREGAER